MAKKRTKPEDLREACVAEAMAIIGESGLEKLSLREVARRLNVSHQAPYKHFPSRDHILAEVVARAYAAFADYLECRPRGGYPAEDLGNMGRAYLEYAQAHPLHYKLMFATKLPEPSEHPEMMRQAKVAFSLLTAAVARLPYRSPDAPPERDALFIWASLHGLSSIMRSDVVATLELPQEVMGAELVKFALRKLSYSLGLDLAR